ncbi:NUDIX hydrolase [Roseovarius aestuarii]|nr:NUDIX hydrolase [Roseovarius aestuarii]
MSRMDTKQSPIDLSEAHKSDVRTQFGALCFRIVRGKVEILLITSRASKRWIIPKGWPMDGKTPSESAQIEAWEEAGVHGKMYNRCLGLYSYRKDIGPAQGVPCVAMVYALKVKRMEHDFPEAKQRKRKWLRPKKAAALVDDPELAQMIRAFDPQVLKK